MGDEELDRARATEAENHVPVTSLVGEYTQQVAIAAARLAREGWTPPDPLAEEIKSWAFELWRVYGHNSHAAMVQAIKRGIKIGRGQ